MRTAVIAALAAAALGTVITPAHAFESCVNHPATLVQAPAGATASCTGPVSPSTVWMAWGPSQAAVRVTCPAYTDSGYADGLPTIHTVLNSGGICTLTVTARFANTTAVATVL